MDLWVVAAAAGAGYIAKNLQNLPSTEKEKSVDSSSNLSTNTSLESRNLLQQIRDKTCPLRRLARKRDASSLQKDGLDRTNGNSNVIVASNDLKEVDYNVVWSNASGPASTGRDLWLSGISEDCSSFELSKFKLLESRPSEYFTKPLSSLRSRLNKEREKVEEFVYNSFRLPYISKGMPLLINEGAEILSTSYSFPLDIWSNGSEDMVSSGACWNETPSSTHPSIELQTKMVHSNESHSPGSPSLMLLFMIGITIGFVSTIIANENKVSGLNEQLKQANNLVQDLHEELEMKNLLTVKDLAGEDSQSLSINREPEIEDPMLRSEIEAELEAELVRLELNINTSVLDTTSESTETLPPNYAVSPRELAIRLHELIESRLEARIMELETAYQNSQDRLQYLESECIIYRDITSAPESQCIISLRVEQR